MRIIKVVHNFCGLIGHTPHRNPSSSVWVFIIKALDNLQSKGIDIFLVVYGLVTCL